MSYKLVLGFLKHGKKPFKNVPPLYMKNKFLTETILTPLIFECRRCQFATDTSANNKEILVYEGRLNSQVRRVKLFSLMTSLTGLLAQPVIIQRANELGTATSSVIALCTTVGFFTFFTPLLLHYVTKKYVTSVLYNPEEDSYIATTYSIFLRKKELQIKPGEGCLPDVPGTFTTISVRGKPLFVDASHFFDVHHYKRIMGFDRPIDFKLSTNSTSAKEKDS